MKSCLVSIYVALCVSLTACTATSPSSAGIAAVAHAAAQETNTPALADRPTPTPPASQTPGIMPLRPASATPTTTPIPGLAASPTTTDDPLPLARSTPTATASATSTEAPATATPCGDTAGIVASISITPTTLHYALDARVYLPPCYTASQTRYPVLYLMHGLNSTENQWIEIGVVTTTDQMIAAGDIGPLIIVMPRDRLDDRLDTAFVTDLIPYIDGNYRTLADREHRAIGGMSRGAGWALHLGLHYPDKFSRIGAHSPAVFYGDENNIRDWTWHLPPDLVPQIYIDIGDNDSLANSAAWLDQIFTWFKVKHTYIIQPGAHIAQYWAAHLPDYLRFYTAGWRQGPTPTPPIQ
jgi:enterochelin esterase-like enzyme